jgi:aspartyl-tRNA(Asn)/glutamyl-tRNA(Gln) amidotransferase subunit A
VTDLLARSTEPSAGDEADPTLLDAGSLARLLEDGALNPVALVEGYLERIQRFDPRIASFVEVYADEALAQAAEAAAGIAAGEPGGPLRGIPVVAKDLYDVRGKPTRSGSLSTGDAPVAADSEAVARLRAAGAIILGKTTTHEFAFGVNTPATRNPWDLDRIPGGSSGGSGAAIAADLAAASLGTDTGGSIRIPAALTGQVGLKATYGRVSKRGVTPLSWSLDHAGPITKTVADAALLMNVLAGHDPGDPYSVARPAEDFTADLDRGVDGLRLGVSEHWFGDSLDADVAAAFEVAVRELERLGAVLVPVRLRNVELSGVVCNVLAGAEAAAYHEARVAENPELFTEDVLLSIRAGSLYSGTTVVNAYRARDLVRQGAREVFDRVDAVVSPTIPMIAPPYGSGRVQLGDEEVAILDGINRMTVPANVIGCPALALPMGLSRERMPISLQVMGRPFDERLLLAIGHAFEQNTEWHTLRPALDWA